MGPFSRNLGINTFTVPAGTLRSSYSHFLVYSRSAGTSDQGGRGARAELPSCRRPSRDAGAATAAATV